MTAGHVQGRVVDPMRDDPPGSHRGDALTGVPAPRTSAPGTATTGKAEQRSQPENCMRLLPKPLVPIHNRSIIA